MWLTRNNGKKTSLLNSKRYISITVNTESLPDEFFGQIGNLYVVHGPIHFQ